MKRPLSLATLWLLLQTSPVWSVPHILVDEVHGQPLTGVLHNLLPSVDFDCLTPQDFPLDVLVAQGIFGSSDTTITFTVPPGAQMLYGRFTFQNLFGFQQPYIYVYDPSDEFVDGQTNGGLHVENPVPGEYRLEYFSWDVTTAYEIGVGPPFFTQQTLAPYDAVCRMWDETMMLFVGNLPDYSAAENGALDGYFAGGGGFLFLKEPFWTIAIKPIINLYSPESVVADLQLAFPGTLTFDEPECRTEPAGRGTLLHWDGMAVPGGGSAGIRYEGKPRRPVHLLEFSISPAGGRALNTSPDPIFDVCVFRYHTPGDVEIAEIARIDGGEEARLSGIGRLTRDATLSRLKSVIAAGGIAAGLLPEEMTEFQQRYRWAERWVNEASTTNQWYALYRIADGAYERLIPLRSDPVPRELVRTMWIVEKDIPDGLPIRSDRIGPEERIFAESRNPDATLVVHEYGIIEQPYSIQPERTLRSTSFFGWTFCDSTTIVDPTDNCGFADCPVFHIWGDHPAVATLSEGVTQVVGMDPGAVHAPFEERVLVGDNDAFCGSEFPPGTYPPVVVAKSIGAGRVLAIHDFGILVDELDNVRFLKNAVSWVTGVPTGAQEPIVVAPGAAGFTLYENQPDPFGPRTTIRYDLSVSSPVRMSVYDVSGRLVRTLVSGERPRGSHRVEWDALDNDGRVVDSGVYFYRLEAGGGTETRRMVHVR